MINVTKVSTISLKDNHKRQSSTRLELEKFGIKTEFHLVERDTGHEERGALTLTGKLLLMHCKIPAANRYLS